MTRTHRRQIERAFSAAHDYDRHARVQRIVARGLAERIAALPLPPSPRVLEIGCGTGFLTEALIECGVGGEWLITDISPAMVERCRILVGDKAGRSFAVLDGEYGEPGEERKFDLICSSLAMQWFDDQATALSRMLGWLDPGGHCLFATLGANSFVEWRAAHEAEGLAAGTPNFLTLAEFDAILPASQAEPHQAVVHVDRHESGLDFMRALKAIGARTAAQRHRPLPPAALRQVVRNFEEGGGSVSYEVVTCHYAVS